MIEMDGIDEDVAFSRSIPPMRRNLLSDICQSFCQPGNQNTIINKKMSLNSPNSINKPSEAVFV